MNDSQRLALYERLMRLKEKELEQRHREVGRNYFSLEYDKAVARLPKAFRDEYVQSGCLHDWAIAKMRMDAARNVHFEIASSAVDISNARDVDWLQLDFCEVSNLRYRFNFPEELYPQDGYGAQYGDGIIDGFFFERVPNAPKRLRAMMYSQSSGWLAFEFGKLKFRKECGRHAE